MVDFVLSLYKYFLLEYFIQFFLTTFACQTNIFSLSGIKIKFEEQTPTNAGLQAGGYGGVVHEHVSVGGVCREGVSDTSHLQVSGSHAWRSQSIQLAVDG